MCLPFLFTTTDSFHISVNDALTLMQTVKKCYMWLRLISLLLLLLHSSLLFKIGNLIFAFLSVCLSVCLGRGEGNFHSTGMQCAVVANSSSSKEDKLVSNLNFQKKKLPLLSHTIDSFFGDTSSFFQLFFCDLPWNETKQTVAIAKLCSIDWIE